MNAPANPSPLYNKSISAASPLPIRLPSGPKTVNRAIFASNNVIVGTITNEITAGTYFCAIFSTLDMNHEVRIAGNTPPWKATFAIVNPAKSQYSAPDGSNT